jgi:hypothetical protein
MTRRVLIALLGAFIVTAGSSTWAAEEDQKRIVNGPSRTSFGGLELILGQGASAETAFQPDASRLLVKTLVGEARIVTSAGNLILVENNEGRMEILLPNGRVIIVEPGKAEIVGRALVDDPGTITIRLSGTGPIAQGPGGPTGGVGVSTTGSVQILQFTPSARIDSPENQLGSFPFFGPTLNSPSPFTQ